MDQTAPAIASDGRRVAFEVQGQGIHVCALGWRSSCETVKSDKGSAGRPSWNPVTGDLVLVNYVVDSGNEDSDIVTMPSSEKTTTPLLKQTGNQDDPDVSRDGRMLVYSSAQTISHHRGGVQVVRQLWVMSLETGVARQLLLGSSQDIQPDWSPSGKKIAFASDRSGEFEIWVVNADGSETRQVTSGPGVKTWPAWSPDEKSIMFTRTNEGREGLWLIDADGSNLRAFEPFGKSSHVQLRDADWR